LLGSLLKQFTVSRPFSNGKLLESILTAESVHKRTGKFVATAKRNLKNNIIPIGLIGKRMNLSQVVITKFHGEFILTAYYEIPR